MGEEGQHSLECIQANHIFPKKTPVLEEENMQVPFPELHGEFTEYVGRAEDAIIAISNYRLHIKFKESVVNSRRSAHTYLDVSTRHLHHMGGLSELTNQRREVLEE